MNLHETQSRAPCEDPADSRETTMRFTIGDILLAATEAIVNPVNCVGIMGRGLAAQFKRAFPENFRVYEAACRRGQLVPGTILTVETGRSSSPRLIFNFPTKRHWRDASRMEDVDSGLRALVREVSAHRIGSIAIPALGCGLGGLAWGDVRPLIEDAFAGSATVDVVVYEPPSGHDGGDDAGKGPRGSRG